LANDAAALTRNDFLNGALKIWQPEQGYRAGIDPVLLAASVPAKAGQSVLELGCGAGVASLCLSRRVGGLQVVGVEVQPLYTALAMRNAKENELEVEVVTADLRDLPSTVRQRSFHHVMANPPFFDRAHGSSASDDGREVGRGETVDLDAWIDAACRRLRPSGLATFIQRAERLPEMAGLMVRRFGDIRILPIAPREGRAARLVLVQGQKGARGQARLLAPLILHEGTKHLADGDDYSMRAREILRNGACLSLRD